MSFNRSLDQSPEDGFFALMPNELQDLILGDCSNEDLLLLRPTSHSFKSSAERVLAKRSGALDYNDFIERLNKLSPAFQQFILKDGTFVLVEEMQKLSKLSTEKRWAELGINQEMAGQLKERIFCLSSESGIIAYKGEFITFEQVVAMPSQYLEVLFSPNGLKALRKKLITPEQAATLPKGRRGEEKIYLEMLLTHDGLKALEEKLITLEQVVAMYSQNLKVLFSPNGLKALREKLITPEQVVVMPKYNHVHCLLSDRGLEALQKGLLTPEQVKKMQFDYFLQLLTDNGLKALEEKLITPEQAAAMPSRWCFKALFSPNGLKALRTKLITPEQAVTVSRHLPSLLSDQGLKVLREQLIVPEQLAGISDTYLLGQLLSNGSESLRRGLTPEYAVTIPRDCKYWSTFDNEDLPPDIRKRFSKLTELFKAIKDKNIQPKSEAAYLFIKECLLEYSRADSGHPILAGAMRLLSGHPRRHHAAMVAQLLLKPAYQGSFDNQTLTEFLRQLKASMLQANIDPYKIAPHGDLRAILVVTRFLVDINFNTLQPSVNLDPSSVPPRSSNIFLNLS